MQMDELMESVDAYFQLGSICYLLLQQLVYYLKVSERCHVSGPK